MARKTLEWHLAANDTQLDQRRTLNDQLETPREVDSFAYFRKRANAHKVAEVLRADGYSVEISRRGLTVSLAAHKLSAVDSVTANAFTTRVFTLVESNGGEYDGWGGAVVAG